MLRSMDDIRAKARNLVEEWFTHQCHNPLQDFCWWYRETSTDLDGDFVIAPTRPEITYFFAGALDRSRTKDQNITSFLETARRLPILSLSNQDRVTA